MPKLPIAVLIMLFGYYLFVAPSSAIAAVLAPALFKSGESISTSVIACPNSEAELENGFVYCSAHVLPSGSVGGNSVRCKSNSSQKNYANITPSVLSQLSFTPAKLDDSSVEVKVSLRVFYKKSGEVCQSATMLNNGFNASEYGVDYIAPQEIIAGDSFITSYQ